jgi:lysophospholipase L1-like esterase
VQAVLAPIALLAAGVVVFCATDGAIMTAIRFSLARRIGGPFSPGIVVVGDSLAAACPWKRLSRRPFGVINLATGGATLKEIAGQIYRARALGDAILVIDGGLNDILFDDADARRIEADFLALLRRIEKPRQVVVTLAPFVADARRAATIREANAIVSQLSKARGYRVVDLNPMVSRGETRRPEMTDDGLHFTPAAQAIWLDAVDAALRQPGPN